MLAALAAQKGGATDGTTVQKNLMAVSGSTKGEECDSYKACLALLKDGKEIQYKGQTSIGAFNDAHDPSSASIGVYKYDADNKPVTPRKAPCRRPDAQRLAVLSGRTMKETVRRKRWQSQAPRRLFHMRNARLSCPERGFTGYFRRRRRGVG